MDDLGYEGRGRRILELERELSEARQGILECQTRILALTEEVAANQTLRRIHDACRESAEKEVDQLTRDRDEAHGQLAESYAAIRAYKKDHDKESQYVAAGEICECVICKAHAAAIRRASEMK